MRCTIFALNLENTNKYIRYILPTTGTKGVVGNEQRQSLLLVADPTPKAIKRERYGEQPC